MFELYIHLPEGPACSSMSVTQHNTQLLMIHGPSQSNFCHWYKFTEHRVHQPAHQLHFHLMSLKSPAPSRGCAVSREAVGQTSNGLMHRPLPCPSPCFVVSLINKYFPIATVFLVALESHGDCWAFFSFFLFLCIHSTAVAVQVSQPKASTYTE